MSLFQTSVLQKHLNLLDSLTIERAYKKYSKHFLNPTIQENIKNSKEEEYQGLFLTDLFVNILGYTLKPNANYNLVAEHKNKTNSKKADGAIINNEQTVAVIELKGTKTKDLESIRQQAFGYKVNHKNCTYVITSNYEKLRFYINDATDFLEFNLFTLTQEEFKLLYLCLFKDHIFSNLPQQIKTESVTEEEKITKSFYNDYSVFKRELYRDLVKQNAKELKNLKNNELVATKELTEQQQEELNRLEKNVKLTLFKKSQKLIDRFLFIFFAEDRGLLPPNSTYKILADWEKLQDLDTDIPLYDRFKLYFKFLDQGRKGTDKKAEIFAYNGGLFKPDTILNNLKIDNELLYKHTKKLSNYDFESQVDVNILGHIFENSLNEIESVNAEIEGGDFDKQKSKRKKDGVFYTPKYITKYIVENTVDKLCTEKKTELGFKEEEYFKSRKNRTKKKLQELIQVLDDYRTWLLQITICDPACGSGAFLNQALNFLIEEHRYIDELKAKVLGGGLVFSDIENTILENNIYGVDINEESVEIAKLSLWLRTAQPRRKLNDLSSNIKCGNSLIDSKAIAGDKAFSWENEFKHVFENGGFDVVIGNPPYVICQPSNTKNEILEYYKSFKVASYKIDLFHLFFEKSINLTKEKGVLSFITPNTYFTNKFIKPLREFILEKTSIIKIINHKNSVFFDASVDVGTIILDKKIKANNKIDIIISDDDANFKTLYEKEQIKWIDDNDKIFNLNKDIPINKEKTINLSGICSSYFGIQAYDRKTSISSEKIDNNYKPVIDGGDIFSYSYSIPNKFFNFIEKNIKSGGDFNFYKNDRIVIRQIGKTPIVGLCKGGIVASNTLFNLNLINENYSLKYVLSILNSNYIKNYWIAKYSDGKQLFPKIKGFQLKELPIPSAVKEEQKPLIEKADKMLSLNEEHQKVSSKFQRTIQRKFELEKLPKKLQDWYKLSYTEFVKELAKKKIKLSLADEAEWEDYFITEQQKAQELQTQITQTDNEIDQMVYKLYGLTEDEIAIVENS